MLVFLQCVVYIFVSDSIILDFYLLLFLKTCAFDVVHSGGICTLNGIEHNIFVNSCLHVPDGLIWRACKTSDIAKLGIPDVGYPEELECNGQIDREHQGDVAIELGCVSTVEDELAYYAKCNYDRRLSKRFNVSFGETHLSRHALGHASHE